MKTKYRAVTCPEQPVGKRAQLLLACGLLAITAACSAPLQGQARVAYGSNHAPSIYTSFEATHTPFPRFPDNAVGFNFGAYIQPFNLLGVEVRGAYLPIEAYNRQTPATVGVRIAKRTQESMWAPYGYAGAGIARVQDQGPNFSATPAKFAFCAQAAAGLDRNFGRYSWRMVEVSITKSFNGLSNPTAYGAGAGIVYHFR